MTSNTPLYGNPRQRQPQSTTTPSSSSLAFTTHLSSLIAQPSSASASSSRGRPRPSKSSKPDIFTKHNKGAHKRAAADLQDDNDENENTALRQVHQNQGDIGGLDEATLHRSKRRMAEKVKMYEDLKGGAYLAGDSDDDEMEATATGGDAYLARLRRKEREGLVDFDRKWADEERKREDGDQDEDLEGGDDDDNASIISYEDELGRTRHGTRAEAALASQANSQDHEDQERWRPQRPENLIYGPAVQSHAFNPDANITSQMSYLASRRDRSPTPPEATHYNPDGEVRNRGTGFYAFSKDEGVRKQQMEELMGVRDETMREREAKQERRAQRERVKDERRKKIEDLRVKRKAEVFLDNLGDLGVA